MPGLVARPHVERLHSVSAETLSGTDPSGVTHRGVTDLWAELALFETREKANCLTKKKKKK